uniref:Uncharacterized protein n=1 Tax=Cacopsylla melanoneura TaxID=428564 RepID=A0A8D8WSL6_9HEMI
MQNHFLCCSTIIIVLNTMSITCSTCETVDVVSGDVHLPPGQRSSTTLRKSSKRNKLDNLNKVTHNMDLETRTKLSNVINFEVCRNISTPIKIKEINMTGTNSPHSKKKNRTYSKEPISRSSHTKLTTEKMLESDSQNTISSHPLVCNCSSCIVNFKSRKKEPVSKCSLSVVSSSQTISSSTVCDVSHMNYINSSSYLKTAGQHLTQTKQYRKRDISTLNQISKRTRKRKSTSPNILNSTKSDGGKELQEEMAIKSSRKFRRSRTKNNVEIHKSLPKLNSVQTEKQSVEGMIIDRKRKLLRQELMKILKNKSLSSLKLISTSQPASVKIDTITDTELLPECVEVPVQDISIVSFNKFSTNSEVRRNKKTTKKKAKLSMPLVANFLLSEESNMSKSGSESLLNHFDEIRLNSANPEAENAALECSNEVFLYVPKNGSTKSVFDLTNKTRKDLLKSNLKYEASSPNRSNKGSNATKRRRSRVDLVTNKTSTLSKLTTYFDLFNFLIYETSPKNSLVPALKRCTRTTTKRIKTGNSNKHTKKRINWNKFLLSTEDIDVNEVGPTVNVFSESIQVSSASNESESPMSEVTMLVTEKLPDINECEQFWNRTFCPPKDSFETSPRQSLEFSTLSSVEALKIIRQNFSGFLTRKSILSGLSTIHPLLDPLASQFDNSILPNDEEAKRIFAKHLNQSLKEVEEKWFTTRITENVQSETFLPLSQLDKLDLDHMSMSLDWKVLIQEALAKTKPHFTDMPEFTFPLPDTAEAEDIFRENDMSDVIRDMELRKNKLTSCTRPFAPSTLSMRDALQIFRQLGIELLGLRAKVDDKFRERKKNKTVLRGRLKKKVPEKVLKNRKVEGYVLNMITKVGPTDQEVYVPWNSHDSGDLKINFDMKLLLNKLITYLDKRTNQTFGELPSNKPERSFLIGKPAYFKKRKNALI